MKTIDIRINRTIAETIDGEDCVSEAYQAEFASDFKVRPQKNGSEVWTITPGLALEIAAWAEHQYDPYGCGDYWREESVGMWRAFGSGAASIRKQVAAAN